MTVKCERCGRELKAYPYKNVKTCIKCTLETNFTRVYAVGRVSL